ncbi:MAG: hypothetical protein R3258_06260 [Acidimicrobiia bacterium]|nr:hypothetical protein [Acidimicrobiia bacterium]
MRVGEAGGATVALVAVAALLATLGIATASLGAAYAARAQAQTASDAAALAAAVATYPGASGSSPHEQAAAVANANGAVVVRCGCAIDPSLSIRVVEVVTAVGIEVPIFGHLRVKAASRAEFNPRVWLGR